MKFDKVFIDIKSCDMTVAEVMQAVQRLQAEYPDYEIFMDGETYSIVGRRRDE